MVRRMLLLVLLLAAGAPVLWRWVGRPWPDRLLSLEDLTVVAQYEPERLVGGMVVVLAWSMWLLLCGYALSALVGAVSAAYPDVEVDRG